MATFLRMKYFLVTYGCQMNRSDAERVAAVLENLGLRPAEDENSARVLGVVACSVRQKSTDRVYGRIVAWNERRDREHIITFVTGCVLPRDRKKLEKLFDILFPIEDLPRFPEFLATHGMSPLSTTTIFGGAPPLRSASPLASAPAFAGSSATPLVRTDYWKIAPQTFSAHQAWIPIQNGCNRFCAYCAVPYTRGREVSRAAGEILDEIARLLEQGCRSFTLLGQNVNSYGRDWNTAGDGPDSGAAFVRLLDDAASLIEKSGREAHIYFTSSHPVDMRREVFELMAARPAIAHQVHLPLQSGDDGVLRRMNRSYTIGRYREIIGWARDLVPDATLFTDIIVGFPGETAAEFERTREAMLEFSFDMAFVAAYSPRQGTAGAKLRDDVPREEKSRRLNILGNLLKEMGAAKKARLIGKTMRVLVDGVARGPGVPAPGRDAPPVNSPAMAHPGADAARTGGGDPPVEAVVSARTNGLLPVHVRLSGEAALDPARLVGGFIDARITGAGALSLAAEYED